jgi:undecaprenyl diphosphate synthase
MQLRLDKNNLPKHIAIIMDGNGRWAEKRGLSRVYGHRAGLKIVREITKASHEIGVKILTLYAFSTENWKRPKREVDTLMYLLEQLLRKEIPAFQKNKVQLRAIGRLGGLPSGVQDALNDAIKATEKNDGGILNLALNYGGRAEIVDGAKKFALNVKEKGYAVDELNEESFGQYLYAGDLPDPDLLIRTGGERRLSNFLLYQLSYTEIFITSVYWPDFKRANLLEAIYDYQQRTRKFGNI